MKIIHQNSVNASTSALEEQDLTENQQCNDSDLLADQTWRGEEQEASSAGLQGIWEEAVGKNPTSSGEDQKISFSNEQRPTSTNTVFHKAPSHEAHT